MFEKILIANRGEIACRVIRTARRMGISTVAVYSDADAGALHVQSADEAIHIGTAASTDSYLRVDRILDAVRRTGAGAVHPGYGFLSENPELARGLEAMDVAFIGPGTDAISKMGDKIESKRIAIDAGVATIPGHVQALADEDEAVQIADEVGYPVMLKASAGGGGKGMRIARTRDGVRDGFRSATSEARSSFGDDRVFVERYIEDPRHIEIQVIADHHGTVLYLGERECSIQRRHQKVLEEAPSPFLDEDTRARMGAQAVALARAVDYRSAGTVEFVVDRDRNFYFLEMNTRLQVEHPVTELVTGLDLVELMIRIACDEPLPFTQSDVRLEGWAIEARIYAEDPFRGFLPSTGRLARFRPPATGDGVRIDTGVAEGAEISMFYDPMIAKLITSGSDRSEAARRMADALERIDIRGVSHNVPFLAALVTHPDFMAGQMTTGFIDAAFPDGFAGAGLDDDRVAALRAVAVARHHTRSRRERRISGQTDLVRRTSIAGPERLLVIDGGTRIGATVTAVEGGFDVELEGHGTVAVRGDCEPERELFAGTVNGTRIVARTGFGQDGHLLQHAGAIRTVRVVAERIWRYLDMMPVKEAPDMSRFLLSPMPGLLVSVAVEPGEQVKAGQELAVVEAMKMENVLRAERDAVVAKVLASPGSSLAVDEAILEFS